MIIIKRIKPYIISFIPLIILIIANSFIPFNSDWYQQPSFQPPNWIFSIVWSIIYLLLGISGGLILNKKDYRSFSIYLINLILNFLWTYLFFSQKLIGISLIEIIVLWLSIIILIYYFNKASHLASKLLIPYFLWVSFAILLNFSVYLLN